MASSILLLASPMSKNFPRTGKKARPKTAVKGKRFLCTKCRKRSPRPVKTPAPWYCPACLEQIDTTPPRIDAGKRPEIEDGP
jgi:hypothetical protein